MSKIFRSYYNLTKPGIIQGNLLTAAGGFLFAAKFHIVLSLFIATISGIALVIASACVFNNYLDRIIDKKMVRTKQRALVTGVISAPAAISYACLLGVVGFGILILYTHPLIVYVGIVAFVDYVVLYGFSKRHSVHSTLVGSVSGAAALVAGYCAVNNTLDTTALLLFILMVCWQMAHFYAIALYRQKDYTAAGMPVFPVKKGVSATKMWILIYIGLFLISLVLLTAVSHVGIVFLVVMTSLAIWWLGLGIRNYHTLDSAIWGKRMFLFSLIVITCLPVLLAASSFLP